MTPSPRLMAALLFCVSFGPLAKAHDHTNMTMPTMETAPLSGQSLYNLPNPWTTQNGETRQLVSLKGSPVVVAMVYTSCKEMCPLTVESMRKIGDAWAKKSKTPLRFALFTFDVDRDIPTRLKDYSLAHKLDDGNWTLFHGDEAAVRNLAATLGVSYRKDANGDFDHAYAITLLDADGAIAYQQAGTQQDMKEWMAQLTKLAGMRK